MQTADSGPRSASPSRTGREEPSSPRKRDDHGGDGRRYDNSSPGRRDEDGEAPQPRVGPSTAAEPPHEAQSRAEDFLTRVGRGETGQWGQGWTSNGPPSADQPSRELKDNLNDTLVKNVFNGWNQGTLARMRQSLAERLDRRVINIWEPDTEPPSAEKDKEDDKKRDHKRRDKERHKESRKSKHKSRDKKSRKSRRYDSDSSSDSDDSRDRRRHRDKKRKRDEKKREEEDDGLEKNEMLMDDSKREEYELMQEMLAKKRKLAEAQAPVVDQSEDTFGPVPMAHVGLAKGYGAAMLPGEADGMAQFVQDNKRIPRRGEIGLTAEEIESYEKLGYQMSGSRHRRMNAVRMRKEGQIYSAEEERILAQINAAERAKRENQVVADFRQLLSSKIKEHAPSEPPK